MQLHRDDLIEVAKEDIELRDILNKIKAKYEFSGNKYDFYTQYHCQDSESNSSKTVLSKENKIRSSFFTSPSRSRKTISVIDNPHLGLRGQATNRHILDSQQISFIKANEVTKYPMWKEFVSKIDLKRL